MKIPTWALYAFVCMVIANNLAWFLAYGDASSARDTPVGSMSDAFDLACGSDTFAPDKEPLPGHGATSVEIAVPRDGVNDSLAPLLAVDAGDEISPEQPASSESEAPAIDVPQEASRNYLYERGFNNDYYSSLGREERLDTIQSLSAQGKDLSLIKEIVLTEGDTALRIAAVSRLAYEHSYAATNILMDALDDPSEEVCLVALRSIANNGDRTLIPLLREKMDAMPNGSVRDGVEKTIRTLEYSVTMKMDEL